MFSVVCSPARVTSRLAVLAVVSAGIAGCSSDISRFNDNPFTGSVAGNTPPAPVGAQAQRAAPPAYYGTAPAYNRGPAATGPRYGQVQSQPLPPMQTASAPLPPPSYQVQHSAPPPSYPAPRVAAAPIHASRQAGVHVVTPGETLFGIARKYGVPRSEIARANGIKPMASVRIGQRLTIPGAGGQASQPRTRTASLAPTVPVHAAPPPPAPKPVVAARPAPAPAPHSPAPAVVASRTPAAAPAPAPVETARLAAPAHDAAAEEKAARPSPTGASASFRWPVRGRVIAGFGPKPNGQQNDGINLAVPEGTSVKAAEDGVVAYAGNELKGYGNLVLVRHANGYVTAYAHASELKVKRGDHVKRGQIIALAGQTGGVSSPQLHFEIRKGSTPVDPMQYMASN
jgi:murein DD-endopeptidase MepM/ murein hydrolase activator NlpD